MSNTMRGFDGSRYAGAGWGMPLVCDGDRHVADLAKIGIFSREPYLCRCGEVYIFGSFLDSTERYVPAHPSLATWWPK